MRVCGSNDALEYLQLVISMTNSPMNVTIYELAVRNPVSRSQPALLTDNPRQSIFNSTRA